MAIALNGGHVSRALEFYNKKNKYFIFGGTAPWKDEPNPDTPSIDEFKLVDVIGLKMIDNTYLVIPDNDNGTIVYRDKKWRIVSEDISTNVTTAVSVGSNVVSVDSVAGFKVGSKVRINNQYEGTITILSNDSFTLDTVAPSLIPSGAVVQGGALIERAKYVYIECSLAYDAFPLEAYRQIGLCTGVIPAESESATHDILLSSAYSKSGKDEFESLGVLEILDNRERIPRDISMKESVSMIIEF